MTIDLSQAEDTGQEGTQHVAARATSSDLVRALSACDFAVLVWELPSGVVRLANQHAADLFDMPLLRLVGSKNTDLLGPKRSVVEAFAALHSGAVEVVCAERRIRIARRVVPALAWSRAVELDGARSLVSLYIPTSAVAGLGRDASAPWRDLAPVVIGTADLQWRIDAISSDIRGLVGAEPRECLGTSLLDFVHPDDVSHLRHQLGANRTVPRAHCYVRMRNRDGSWVDVCVLVADLSANSAERIAFAALGVPHATNGTSHDRVRELELRLRHIAAEVRAAGVLDELEVMPAAGDHPRLSELSSRQWEILSRLIRGERVSTIARELFISQSTVRNHLAGIYARFDVHSQAELLDVLRRPAPAAT